MMYRLLPIILLITFIITCCSSDKVHQVNKSSLNKLITKALTGDAEANADLKGLFRYKHIGKTDYNQLGIDSFQTDSKKYYSVLVEYSDPMLNLFAIYDDKLNLYLLDKSLNGNLSDEWMQVGSRNFCFVQEKFLTKDILNLDRLSIYEIKNDTINLIYRSLSRFANGKEVATQIIESITQPYIVTKLSGLKDKSINEQPDTFYFNTAAKEYLSKLNLFSNYVKQQIKESGIIQVKPEIPSDKLENFNSQKK